MQEMEGDLPAGDSEAPEPGTRQKLLDAARKALLDKGHIKTTVKEIAATAGVNHGLVHHYFRSKEHLFVELIKESPAYLEDVTPLSDRERTIDYLIDNLFNNTRLHVQFHALAHDMPEVQEALKQVLNVKRAEIQKSLGIQDPITASMILAIVSGLVLHYNLDQTIPIKETLLRTYALLVGENLEPQTETGPHGGENPGPNS